MIGGKVKFINYNGGLGEVRTQVESGTITWDIVPTFCLMRHELAVTKVCFEELPRDVFAKAPDGTPMDDDMYCPCSQ